MYSQKNIEQLFKIIGTVPGQTFVQTDYYDYIKSTNSIWPNLLFNLNVSTEKLHQVLKEIDNLQHKGEVPNLLMGNPTTDNPDIIHQIKHRQYRTGAWTAMTHDLSIAKVASI